MAREVFDDELLDPSEYGIFAGTEGLGVVSKMDVKPTEDGLEMTRACEVCNRFMRATLSWPELYCVSKGVLPQMTGRTDIFRTHWNIHRGLKCMYPEIRCSCQSPGPVVMFDMTPQKANAALTNASQNNTITPRDLQIIKAIQPNVQAATGRR
jgi:hypothetical protein